MLDQFPPELVTHIALQCNDTTAGFALCGSNQRKKARSAHDTQNGRMHMLSRAVK